MIKENQRLLNVLNVISDALISILAVLLAFFIVFYLFAFERNFLLIDYIKLACIFVPVQLVTYGCMGLYDSHRTDNLSREFATLVGAFFIDGLLIVAMLYIVKLFDFSRWALAIFLVLDLIFIAVKRIILRSTLRRLRSKGYNQKHILIVGGGETASYFLKTISDEKHLGLKCDGYLADSEELEAERLGGFDDVLATLDGNSYDEVVCALDIDEIQYLQSVVEACEVTGTRICVIPAMYKYMSQTSVIDMIGNIPVMNIRRIPLDNMGNAFMKRAMDIVGSLIMLILSSPVMLVTAIVIKATMGGKVIFRQQRVGFNKKLFTMYKFKSMRDSSISETAWSTDSDPRKTRFGAIIRKLSIDELPQLVNVLKGEMSLVGPRPELPFYVDAFKNEVPMYMIKHQVKPGMTGLAQINGFRGDTSIKRRIELDVRYIETWNIFLDISILFKTVFRTVNKEKLRCSETAEEIHYQQENTDDKNEQKVNA